MLTEANWYAQMTRPGLGPDPFVVLTWSISDRKNDLHTIATGGRVGLYSGK